MYKIFIVGTVQNLVIDESIIQIQEHKDNILANLVTIPLNHLQYKLQLECIKKQEERLRVHMYNIEIRVINICN